MGELRRLCVFCGSSAGHAPEYRAAAVALGDHLVAEGVELVYGGGAVGLMGVIADTVMEADGAVIGVLPEGLFSKEVGHDEITQLIEVPSMHERKALMYELSDGFIALPGGIGTLEELAETLTWGQIGLHAKPIGLLDVNGYFASLTAFLHHSVAEGFMKEKNLDLFTVADTPAELTRRFRAWSPDQPAKWIEPDRI